MTTRKFYRLMELETKIKEEHKHTWKDAGIIEEDDMLYSPVSARDHIYFTRHILIRTCECGTIRRTEVGRNYK